MSLYTNRSWNRWLAQQRRRHDPVGDLARDVAADDSWPTDSRRRDLHTYLARMNACDGAHRALDRAWFEWRHDLRAADTAAGRSTT